MNCKGFGTAIAMVLIIIGAVAPLAQAEKVYRWIDPQGNVTYQDQPPPSGAGTFEIKEIDPSATTTQFERPNMTPSDGSAAVEGAAEAASAKPNQRARRARLRAAGGGQTDEPVSTAPAAAAGPLLPTPSAGLPAVPASGALAPPPPAPPPPPPAAGAF